MIGFTKEVMFLGAIIVVAVFQQCPFSVNAFSSTILLVGSSRRSSSTTSTTTALFSGFPSHNPNPQRSDKSTTTTTTLRLTTNLRIPPPSSIPLSSTIVPTILHQKNQNQHQSRNFLKNVRYMNKKAALSSVFLFSRMLYEDGTQTYINDNTNKINTSNHNDNHMLRSRRRSTLTHRETHRTRLAESCTFEFERREHKEVEGWIDEIYATNIESVSGVGVGGGHTNDGVNENMNMNTHQRNKEKIKKEKIIEVYSQSSDPGDRAFAALLELHIVELTPDFENPDCSDILSVGEKQHQGDDDDDDNNNNTYIDPFISEDTQIKSLKDEIQKVIATEKTAKNKVQVIDKYSKSSDQGKLAFDSILAQLTTDPENLADDENSTNDLFAP